MTEKRILICGAAGGIGEYLASAFPLDICMLHYHSKMPKMTGNGHPIRADLARFTEVENMIESLLSVWGGIDVVINASGLSLNGFAHKLDPVSWASVIDVNLTGSFNLIRAVLPSMRKQKHGRIILMSSVVSQTPVMGTAAYSASKAGLSGLARTVALENAALGITCNCIALGYIDAGMISQVPQDRLEALKALIPVGRLGRLDEIDRTVKFLIETEYITGQTMNLNGGLYA